MRQIMPSQTVVKHQQNIPCSPMTNKIYHPVSYLTPILPSKSPKKEEDLEKLKKIISEKDEEIAQWKNRQCVLEKKEDKEDKIKILRKEQETLIEKFKDEKQNASKATMKQFMETEKLKLIENKASQLLGTNERYIEKISKAESELVQWKKNYDNLKQLYEDRIKMINQNWNYASTLSIENEKTQINQQQSTQVRNLEQQMLQKDQMIAEQKKTISMLEISNQSLLALKEKIKSQESTILSLSLEREKVSMMQNKIAELQKKHEKDLEETAVKITEDCMLEMEAKKGTEIEERNQLISQEIQKLSKSIEELVEENDKLRKIIKKLEQENSQKIDLISKECEFKTLKQKEEFEKQWNFQKGGLSQLENRMTDQAKERQNQINKLKQYEQQLNKLQKQICFQEESEINFRGLKEKNDNLISTVILKDKEISSLQNKISELEKLRLWCQDLEQNNKLIFADNEKLKTVLIGRWKESIHI